jgi:hypothetical protein
MKNEKTILFYTIAQLTPLVGVTKEHLKTTQRSKEVL